MARNKGRKDMENEVGVLADQMGKTKEEAT
jgi:hypothetical protein